MPSSEGEDPWPDEPDEFDPSSLGPDPDELGPDPAELGPDPPEVRDYSEVDVPPDVAQAFWGAVLLANVALLGLSLGPMLVYFWGDWDLGGGVFLVGFVALLLTYRRYYRFMNRDRDDGEADRDGEEPTGGD